MYAVNNPLVFVDPTGLDVGRKDVYKRSEIVDENWKNGSSSLPDPKDVEVVKKGLASEEQNRLAEKENIQKWKEENPYSYAQLTQGQDNTPWYGKIPGATDLVEGGYFFLRNTVGGEGYGDYAYSPIRNSEVSPKQQQGEAFQAFVTAATSGVTALAEGSVSTTTSAASVLDDFSNAVANTAKGGRVFWSGGREIAGKSAMDWAQTHGAKTLEMTIPGKLMERFGKLLPRELQTKAWENLSRNFAKGATGSVNVFQNTAGVSIKSFWANIEYKELVKKGVDIIYHAVNPAD